MSFAQGQGMSQNLVTNQVLTNQVTFANSITVDAD